MSDKERMVAIMRGGGFSNYPELADLLIKDGCGYNKSFNYTAAFNAQDQARITDLSSLLAVAERALEIACRCIITQELGDEEEYNEVVERWKEENGVEGYGVSNGDIQQYLLELAQRELMEESDG